MLDVFESIAAIAHIIVGVLIGYGIPTTGKKRWIAWGLAAALTIGEAIRFTMMGPS